MGRAILGSDCMVRARVTGQYIRQRSGSDCRVRVRGMGQESNVKTIPRARVQGKGKSQRDKDRGLVNGQGHTHG